jgi:hypothetical protein
MAQPLVFVSYSRRDEAIKDRLLTHLRVLERGGDVEIFDTSDIGPGDKWQERIHEAIERASVALLIVSPDFLASDFITQVELPRLLERHERGDVVVIPVIARPAAWTQVPALRRMQAWPRDARPLTEIDNVHLDRELAELAQRISDLAGAISTKSPPVTAPPDTTAKPKPSPKPIREHKRQFFVSHAREDGDFAELLKLRLEKEGLTAWIDIERLNVGEDWRQEIDTAIQNTVALIVVMTPSARQSDYVTYEWAFAWGAGVPVIPILLKETPMHPRLESLQYLDFTNQIARPWTKLLNVLASVAAKHRES